MGTRTLTLADGRALCLAQYGDPDGPPVFYFHGYPGSRLEVALLDGLPLRVIAIDRPGYGGSSPLPGRGLLDWPADVAAAADQLGLARFTVLGVSGGGPYAAACAFALPGRVKAAILLCPVPPPETIDRLAPGQRGDLGLLMQLGRHPRAARPFLATARWLGRQPHLLTPETIRRFGPLRLPPTDMAALAEPASSRTLASFREGVRECIEGVWMDAQIYARPWGFALEHIGVPLAVWHGTADTIVPFRTSEAYCAVPGCRRTLVDGAGHYAMVITHGPGIVAEFVRSAPQ